MAKTNSQVEVATFYQRIFAYLIDLTLLICITSFILYPLHKQFALFDLVEVYSYGTRGITTSYADKLLVSSMIFVIVSFVYFFFEIYGNLSLGNRLVHGKIVLLKTDNSYISKTLIRTAIKAFPITNIVDSLSLLRKRERPQKFTEQALHIFYIDNAKKKHLYDYILISAILYYLPLFTISIITLMIGKTYFSGGSGSIAPYHNPTFNQLNNILIGNNTSYDLQLELGGLFLLIPTIFVLYTSSLLEGSVMGMALLGNKYTFVDKVLPQFFPETFAYVLGIAFAMCVVTIVTSFIENYTKGISYKEFQNILKAETSMFVFYFATSMFLIFIAANIESYVLG